MIRSVPDFTDWKSAGNRGLDFSKYVLSFPLRCVHKKKYINKQKASIHKS